MADNPRVALYHSHYTAALANHNGAGPNRKTSVVGKFCESGDVLINSAELPVMQRGDILVMPAAGAYQVSMSSNYNLAPRPAVLWLEDGKIEVLQKREEIDEESWWVSAA
jgi:diaminopimelate decarboxylase